MQFYRKVYPDPRGFSLFYSPVVAHCGNLLNQQSEIDNGQRPRSAPSGYSHQPSARQLELHRDLRLNLNRLTIQQIRFVLPLLHRVNRGVCELRVSIENLYC